MSFPVDAYQTEISQIVGDVFLTMLGLEIEASPEPWSPRHGDVTAAIFFAGAWKGAALLECTEQQARCWTARLMSVAEPEDVTDDVRDAVGEVVNMIGGNLKSVLPAGVGLSMPSVVQGKDYSMQVCGGNLVNHQGFQCDNSRFGVTLVEVVER